MKNVNFCPICSSESYFWATSENKGLILNIFKCKKCGHGFIDPPLSQKELNNFYDINYMESYNPDMKTEEFKLREKQYEFDVNLLNNFFLKKSNISVLDYGCSTGQFLKVMPLNWNKNGFEINNHEIEYIKKTFPNISIYSNVLDIDEKFNLITLRGVIEHILDFSDLYHVLNNCLDIGGLVYICATPDFNSPCSVVYLEKWNQICPPIHYHQFTFSSLVLFFAKLGYSVKAVYHPYLDTPYAHFPDDGLKFINNLESLNSTKHAFPGNMMSVIFERIKKIS